MTTAPVISAIVKRLGGVAPERPAPTFATTTFRRWFEDRDSRPEGEPVLLWPDTFTNYFDPHVGRAAVESLEEAGYRVAIPRHVLCCGRPLYDYGMLPTAKRLLRRAVEALRPWIDEGVPIVGLEPSCVAVFRDELVNLLPHDEHAKRLSRQVRTFAELLDEKGYEPPRLPLRALVHGHCHHKAIMKLDADVRLIDRLGLDYDVLDSGCCGLAGSFGFERGEKYEVSVRAGERVLLPAVRGAPRDALVVTDGFSCRTQIEHLTDRSALHIAEVVRMAQRREDHAVGRSRAGRAEPQPPSTSSSSMGVGPPGALVLGLLGWAAGRGHGGTDGKR